MCVPGFGVGLARGARQQCRLSGVGPVADSGGLTSMDLSDHPLFLLKPSDVVQILGVSRSWLYDAAKSGRIPCVRLGGHDGPVRFRADEIAAWVEASRVMPVGVISETPPAVDRRRMEPRAPAHDAGTATAEQLRFLPPLSDA